MWIHCTRMLTTLGALLHVQQQFMALACAVQWLQSS
jgi:hypothetical protein